MTRTFYEFFAGGGMASQGLGADWRCLFANDIDPEKARAFAANNPDAPFMLRDIDLIDATEIPGAVDLSWASFPCQDLSLAGNGAGLAGRRSGAFWAYWKLMRTLAHEGRAPRIIALENVVGAITSHGGKDLATIADAFADLGYRFGCLVVNAAHFVAQSRPRLFVIGIRGDLAIPDFLLESAEQNLWTTPALTRAMRGFSAEAMHKFLRWRLPQPPLRNSSLIDILEPSAASSDWHAAAQTARLLGLMDGNNLEKLRAAKAERRPVAGCVYRRTRPDGRGGKTQRAEVRFDGLAGCLRTPAGGSSRQTLLLVDGDSVRSRLLAPREAARLMGLRDDYKLPQRPNEAYRLLGDGVVAPVVGFLAANLFQPLLDNNVGRAAA